MAQVEARQLIAILKHKRHIGDLAGVQVAHARDGLKILHAVKPIEGGRRAIIGKRRVKDHLGHIGFGAVVVPIGILAARVQVLGRSCAGTAQVVVVERQCRVRRRVVGIGLGSLHTQGAHHGRHQGEESEK